MYITRQDLSDAVSLYELAQLSNDDPMSAQTEPNWNIVDRAIAYACELTDGYLMGRYNLPLEDAPSILRALCTDIARHWLHRRRINTADFPKSLEDAYKNALKLLEQIRDGKLQLGLRTQSESMGATGAGDSATTATRPQAEVGAYQVRAQAKQDWSAYE